MKPWRAQVRGNHFVVLGANGDEILTSKEYADDGGAKRAARNFAEAMQRELVLEYDSADGETVRQTFGGSAKRPDPVQSRGSQSPYAGGQRIDPPVAGKTIHALSPYAQ